MDDLANDCELRETSFQKLCKADAKLKLNVMQVEESDSDCSMQKECRIWYRGPKDDEIERRRKTRVTSGLDVIRAYVRHYFDKSSEFKPFRLNQFFDEELINPCYCKGTLKYVHRSCLEKWLTLHVKPLQNDDDDMFPILQDPELKCELWKFKYTASYKYKSIKNIVDKLYSGLTDNRFQMLKSLLYLLYFYLFCSQTLSIAKILLIVFIKHLNGWVSENHF